MSTKWAENCDPDTPAAEFARSVLAERMEAVESLLPLAAHHYLEDIEHVHQLRVACRRASAALRAFSPLMRRKPAKLKKWLSRIRDAAGPARDIDVLLAQFAYEKRPDLVTEYATTRLQAERDHAQKTLVKVSKEASRGKLDRTINRSLKLIKNRKSQLLSHYGHDAVRMAYLPFARLLHLQNSSTAELHQLRIAGKRLRYSLEIFHGLFSEELRESIYPLFEDLQDKLGEINDHATAQALYQSWLAEMPADDLAAATAGRVISEHEATVRLGTQFTRWWSSRRMARIESFFQKQLP